MRKLYYILLLLPILLVACGRKMVLDKEEMAQLMADIHIAEAVVDMNSSTFPTDSSRQALKQSIYEAHGVTSEQVESSYVWYGHHIEDYMAVYDRTISIIEERQRDMLTASSQQVLVAGDSVDIWPLANRLELSQRSPLKIISFNIPVDSNWLHHDVFTLNFNIASSMNPVDARMNIEYANGATYFSSLTGRSKGKGNVSVRVDSTMQPLRIVGYIRTNPRPGETVLIDSIALVRTREYIPVGYVSMRQFNYGEKNIHGNIGNAQRRDSLRGGIGSNSSSQATPTGHSSHSQGGSAASPKDNQVATSTSRQSTAQEALRERNEMLRRAGRK